MPLLRSKPSLRVVAMAGVFLLSLVYLWEQRYYLRFVPIPILAMDVLYDLDGVLPLVTPMTP